MAGHQECRCGHRAWAAIPPEAHPCGFKWVIEAKIENNAKLVVVDPRFTRTASVADVYAPIRPGTDIAFLSGVIRYLLRRTRFSTNTCARITNAGFIVKEGFGFEDGLFTGYDEGTRSYDKSSWDYEYDEDGFAKVDDTWQNPRCAINLLRKHVERYTPEMVSRICGTPQDKFLQICDLFASCSVPHRALTSLYALGWTQHSHGTQNIRAMAMIQLLLGNVGVAGGGINALRGHSNIQGLTDIGLLSDAMPGYLKLPTDSEPDFGDLYEVEALQAAAAETDELLAELSQVLRQPSEGSLRRRRAGRQRLGLRLAAQARRAALRYHSHLRDDVEWRDKRLHLPRLQPHAVVPGPGQDPQGAGQVEVPRHNGPARHGDLAVLAKFWAAKSLRSCKHTDRSLPAADHELCRRAGVDRQLRALAAMALEGGQCAGRSQT